MKIRHLLMIAAAALFMVACSDDKKKNNEKTEQVAFSIPADKFETWTYVNLITGDVTERTVEGDWKYYIFADGVIPKEGDEMPKLDAVKKVKAEGSLPEDWHIAIHRYDIRTNNGMVLKTDAHSFSEITGLPKGDYKSDELFKAEGKGLMNSLMVDMSQMMSSKIGFADGYKNDVLCGWVKRIPTGSMPPYKFEISDNVFVVKFTDGSRAKLKFTSDKNEKGKKAVEFKVQMFTKN